MVADENTEVMDVDDLAGYLKLSKSSVYKMLRLGKIPGRKIGKHWRFHRDVIEKWVKEGESSKNKRRLSR